MNDNYDYDENKLDVSNEVEELSDERKSKCLFRAARELNIDLETASLEELEQNDEFCAEYELQLKMAVLSDMFEELQKDGLIEFQGVNEDGEILYGLTEKGIKRVESGFDT